MPDTNPETTANQPLTASERERVIANIDVHPGRDSGEMHGLLQLMLLQEVAVQLCRMNDLREAELRGEFKPKVTVHSAPVAPYLGMSLQDWLESERNRAVRAAEERQSAQEERRKAQADLDATDMLEAKLAAALAENSKQCDVQSIAVAGALTAEQRIADASEKAWELRVATGSSKAERKFWEGLHAKAKADRLTEQERRSIDWAIAEQKRSQGVADAAIAANQAMEERRKASLQSIAAKQYLPEPEEPLIQAHFKVTRAQMMEMQDYFNKTSKPNAALRDLLTKPSVFDKFDEKPVYQGSEVCAVCGLSIEPASNGKDWTHRIGGGIRHGGKVEPKKAEPKKKSYVGERYEYDYDLNNTPMHPATP